MNGRNLFTIGETYLTDVEAFELLSAHHDEGGVDYSRSGKYTSHSRTNGPFTKSTTKFVCKSTGGCRFEAIFHRRLLGPRRQRHYSDNEFFLYRFIEHSGDCANLPRKQRHEGDGCLYILAEACDGSTANDLSDGTSASNSTTTEITAANTTTGDLDMANVHVKPKRSDGSTRPVANDWLDRKAAKQASLNQSDLEKYYDFHDVISIYPVSDTIKDITFSGIKSRLPRRASPEMMLSVQYKWYREHDVRSRRGEDRVEYR